MQRRCGRLPGRAIDVVCNVAELNRSNRPTPATGTRELGALKRPFAACGKLIGEWTPDCAPSRMEPPNS
jgi:hypothetical protein